MKDTEKLQKILARSGYGSRRELEAMITAGRIRVDDHVATLGERVTASSVISIDGHKATVRNEEDMPCRVLVYHKPEGELVTRKDPEGRATVYERMPFIANGRWIAVGRLDINTSGMLLMTTDGELANRLMHPSYEVEREYAVRVFGEVGEAKIQKLLKGVQLEDGMAKFKKIVRRGGEGMNQWFHVILTEGRNREVRRLWESQGLIVNRLIRVRIGDLHLPKGLVQGGWMELQAPEVNYLRKLVQMPMVESAVVVSDTDQERQMRQARRAGNKHRQEMQQRAKESRKRKPGSANDKFKTASNENAAEASKGKRSEQRDDKPARGSRTEHGKPDGRVGGRPNAKPSGKPSAGKAGINNANAKKRRPKKRPQRQHQGGS